jgi:regulator of sigma E protease
VTVVPNVLAAIIAFGAMIFVHELGHFLMARRAGVRVHALALGFGPKVLSWRRGETTYSVNLLPLGGYVRMEGEDGVSETPEGESRAASFQSKSVGARMGIIAAGPVMNMVFAVLILAVAAATGGVPSGVTTTVGTLEAGWPAEAAGLRARDVIVAIDGVAMTSGEQIIDTIHQSAGRELRMDVRRGGETMTLRVTPRLDPQRNVGRIGFSPEPEWTRLNPLSAAAWGVQRTGEFIVLLGGAIHMLIRQGQLLENLGGPVAVGSMLAQAAATGFQAFLHLSAFLSVMIGIFNLLPIPALDGGRLAFLTVEAIRRRPIDPRREGWVHMVGFVLLLLLILSLTVRDIQRL